MSNSDQELPRRPSIRAVSRDEPPKGMDALKACRCFPEVDRRLRLGWSSIDLCKMIQGEYKEMADLGESYIKRLIDQYRHTIPAAELVLTSMNPIVARNAQKKLDTGLDELKELERLYNLQMSRIKIDADNETKINKLFPTTGREVFYAVKILKQSAELKADLGIYKRQLGSMEITAQGAIDVGRRYKDDGIGRAMTDPDSRRKVLSMVETLMEMGAGASFDALDVIDAESSEVDMAVSNEATVD